jgi:hypothetical protein
MRKSTKFLPALSLGVAGAISAAAPALAAPITYTMQDTASGSLDGTSFTNSTLTLTFVGDTDNIDASMAPFYVNSPDLIVTGTTVTVSVSGVNGGAPVMFTPDSISVYSDQNGVLGPTVAFEDSNFDIIDDVNNSAFSTYTLGPIGPIIGADNATVGNANYGFALEGGGLLFVTGATASDISFTATGPTAVPAPPIGRGLALAVVGTLLLRMRLSKRRSGGPETRDHRSAFVR